MPSCDNAQVVHPNYRQKDDATNCVYMNDGIVIKSHADRKYTSDAVSVAVFRMIWQKQAYQYSILLIVRMTKKAHWGILR